MNIKSNLNDEINYWWNYVKQDRLKKVFKTIPDVDVKLELEEFKNHMTQSDF